MPLNLVCTHISTISSINQSHSASITHPSHPFWAPSPTGGRDDNWLQLPLLPSGRQGEGEHQHGAQGRAHKQAGGQGAVPPPGEGIAELEGGDGLAGLLVDAGDAGGARAAEGIVPVV